MASAGFHNVTKVFDGDKTALRHFTLGIDDGEFVVLVGPSGCGKSTALRLLAGLDTPTTGEILIDGEPVNQAAPQQRNIAMVFQNYALYPHMTVYDNLAFPLRMAHLSRPEVNTRVQDIARLLELETLLRRKPRALSGGQRQRVAMGRALVRDPSVFLLDEPLSNLDARLRAQIRADIAALQHRLHKTTVYVTHDQVEAMTLGERVVVMNHGELQQVGTPQMLYEQPRNTFVAQFIGSPGMNLLAARITDLQTVSGGIRCRLSLAGQRLEVSLPEAPYAKALAANRDHPLTLGLRPEHLQITAPENGPGLELVVDAVEYLGHESLVYARSVAASQADADTTTRVIGRVPGKPSFEHGMPIRLCFDPAMLHLFDDTGRNIGYPDMQGNGRNGGFT